jgi:uncharacterized protein YbcI
MDNNAIKNLDALIQDELQEWQKEGLNPQALCVNTWFAHNEHIALMELLIEKGILEVDELNIKVRQVNLRMLKEARKQFGTEIRKARILDGVTLKEPLH